MDSSDFVVEDVPTDVDRRCLNRTPLDATHCWSAMLLYFRETMIISSINRVDLQSSPPPPPPISINPLRSPTHPPSERRQSAVLLRGAYHFLPVQSLNQTNQTSKSAADHLPITIIACPIHAIYQHHHHHLQQQHQQEEIYSLIMRAMRQLFDSVKRVEKIIVKRRSL